MIEIGEIHIAQRKYLYFFEIVQAWSLFFCFSDVTVKGFEIKFLSYYFETKLADTAATCFSSSQFAKKLTLRMKIKLKDSSPLAKLPIAKRKDKNRFWKTKLLHTHYTTRYIYRVIQPIRSWPTEPQKVALLSGRNVMLRANAVFWL